MKSIAAYVFGGLALLSAINGCAKRAIADPAEAVLILSSFQAVEDKESVAAANELSVLLVDLHSCLFSEEGGAPMEPLSEGYLGMTARMNAWRKHPHPSRPIVFNLKEDAYSSPWDSEGLAQLAQLYPHEKELWGFFEEAAGFMWDSASHVPDTWLCMWIWQYSPLRGEALSEFAWKPTIEPSLHRLVENLRFEVEDASALSDRQLRMVYGNTFLEFSASCQNDAQACARFLHAVRDGLSPSAAEVEKAMQGTFRRRHAQMTAEALKRFKERLTE